VPGQHGLPPVFAVRALLAPCGGDPAVEQFDWDVERALAASAAGGFPDPLRTVLWRWLETALFAAKPSGLSGLTIEQRGAHMNDLAERWMAEHGEPSPIPPAIAHHRTHRQAATGVREVWLTSPEAENWPGMAVRVRTHDPDCHSLIHWLYLPNGPDERPQDVTACDGECGLEFRVRGLSATGTDKTPPRLCDCCLRAYARMLPSRQIQH
jgi:hypothetical protein